METLVIVAGYKIGIDEYGMEEVNNLQDFMLSKRGLEGQNATRRYALQKAKELGWQDREYYVTFSYDIEEPGTYTIITRFVKK